MVSNVYILQKTHTHERRYMNSASVPYMTVLEKQAEERQLRQQLSKHQEMVEAQQVSRKEKKNHSIVIMC